jgi:hypothetical protein
MKNLAVLVTLLAGSGVAQDWLTYGGDPERTNWQKYERDLNKDNVRNLRLLWKRQLDNQPDGRNVLTAPLILGPTITHRGIKELVFVAGASDNIYAVDADLGRLFWKRHIDTAPKSPCGLGLTATPVLAPLQTPKPRANDDDPVQMRPLYVLASDGGLHTIRISTGLDMAAPVKFLPPNANASNLSLVSHVIHTTTPGNCGDARNGVWSVDMTVPDAHVTFSPAKTEGFLSTWKGKDLMPGVTNLATWEDASGTRWIYAAGKRSIEAYKVLEKDGNPKLTSVWTSRALTSGVPPVVVNGMVFALTDSTLFAFDAATGKELYSSGNAITSSTNSKGLAEANGHVCFGTKDNTLYCFGLPIETQ